MTDLGFGLVDRRTVIAVLITLMLAEGILGLTIPIDITDVRHLFADLVLLTGYLYATRTLFRLPYSLVLGFQRGMRQFRLLGGDLDYTLVERLQLSMGELVPELLTPYDTGGSLGILDRLGVIGLTFLATLPQLRAYVQFLGVCGLVFLLLLYAFRGTFCLLLEDAFKKAEDDHERLVQAARSFPGVIETRPYRSWDY